MPAPIPETSRPLPASKGAGAPPLPTPSIWETIGAAQRTAQDETSDAIRGRHREGYEDLAAQLGRMGVSRDRLTADQPWWQLPAPGGSLDYDKVFSSAREAGFKGLPGTRKEYDQSLAGRGGEYAKDRALQDRASGVSGFAGNLIGGGLADMADSDLGPLQFMVGAGGGTIWQVGAREGALNLILEGVKTEERVKNRQALGGEMGTGEIAMNLGGAFAFGFAVPVVGRALGRGIDAAQGGFERAVADNWDRIPEGLRSRWAARATITDANQGEMLLADMAEAVIGRDRMSEAEASAVNALRRNAEIEQASPFVANGAGVSEHTTRLDAALARLTGTEASLPVQFRASAPVPAAAMPPMSSVGREVGGFNLDSYMLRNRSAESGGSDAAAAVTSSAFGRYQFLKETWLSYYRATYGNTGESREAILRKRADGNAQDAVMRTFTTALAQDLRRAGVAVNDGNMYLAHFLGTADALKVLKATDDAPVSGLVRAASIKANRSVFDRAGSAGELRAWAERKMGGDGASVPARAGANSVADDALAAEDAAIAAERGRIDSEQAALSRDRAQDEWDVPALPELRRDLFEDETSWRIAQSRADAEALGMPEPAITRQSIWADARDQLMADKAGEVRGALYHPDVGPIDVRWGGEKDGLAKIVSRHDEVLEDLPLLLESMGVKSRSENRIVLQSLDHKAVVRLDYDGEAQQWLLSAYQVKGKAPPPADYRGAGGDARDHSPSAGADANIAQTGGSDNIDAIPAQRMGDFFEVIGDDAPRVAKALDVALVTRDGKPMVGIPAHAFDDWTRALADQDIHVVDAARAVPQDMPGGAQRDALEAEGLIPATPLDDVTARRFDDPAGAEMRKLADGTWHDILVAEDPDLRIDMGDGQGERSIAEIRAELDKDAADIGVIEACMRPGMNGGDA